jgi:hypothetical protein
MAVRLCLNHIAELDRLVALEYGRVDDSQPAESWRPVGEHVGYLHDGPGGPELGFKVLGFSQLNVESDALVEIWGAPRFDVPVLGLTGVSAGEIIVAARALFGDRSTQPGALLARGRRHRPGGACAVVVVPAGGGRHGALRAGLHAVWARAPPGGLPPPASLHRDRAARQLELVLVGKAAQALGLRGEARAAYLRAIALEEAGDQRTDARDLLRSLAG